MPYNVLLEKETEKYLSRLSPSAKTRIIRALSRLETDPYLGKMLSGELKGLFSLRVGGLRAIYSIEGSDVVVHAIAPRGQAYK